MLCLLLNTSYRLIGICILPPQFQVDNMKKTYIKPRKSLGAKTLKYLFVFNSSYSCVIHSTLVSDVFGLTNAVNTIVLTFEMPEVR